MGTSFNADGSAVWHHHRIEPHADIASAVRRFQMAKNSGSCGYDNFSAALVVVLNNGKGPPFKKIGRLVRYPELGLREYINGK